MNARSRKPDVRSFTLKDAFETEFARREMERRAREEAERRQQQADLDGAEQLHAALAADGDFLESRGLAVDRRRYVVSLDHERFRISAYFEAGKVAVTLSDKRTLGAPIQRRQETAAGVDDALRLIAQFLVDETR
jgi:hypothetical protein